MFPPDKMTAQLMCEPRWVRSTADRDEPHCLGCDLSCREDVEGTVGAALSRMDAL